MLLESLRRCLSEFLLRFLSKFHSGFCDYPVFLTGIIPGIPTYVSHIFAGSLVEFLRVCATKLIPVFIYCSSRDFLQSSSQDVPRNIYKSLSLYTLEVPPKISIGVHPEISLKVWSGIYFEDISGFLADYFLGICFAYSRRNSPRVSPGVSICICIF